MATRNLTKRFLDLRNAERTKRGGSFKSGGVGETTNPLLAGANLSPAWMEKISLTDNIISNITKKMKQLSNLHAKRLKVNFRSTEREEDLEINQKTDEITDLFRRAEATVKSFKVLGSNEQVNKGDLAVRENVTRTFARKLQTLSGSFRSSQKEYLGKLKEQKKPTLGTLDFLTSDEANEDAENVDHGFDQNQIREVDNLSQLVDARDLEINRIAKSVEELATLFKDLSAMVVHQGTILDRIDYNMEQSVNFMVEANQELTTAEQYQKSSMPKKCMGCLVALIIAMIIILFAKHSSRSN